MRLTDDEKRQIDELNRAGESVLAIAGYLDIPPDEVRKYLKKAAKDRGGKLSGAAFMIGLGVLLLLKLECFPAILFVIAASSLARGLGEGDLGGSAQGAIWLAGIGLMIVMGEFSLPVLFIMIGLSSLFGALAWGSQSRRAAQAEQWRKRKNDERRADEYEKPKRSAMRLADDGELIDIVDDDEDEVYRRRDE